MTSAMAVIAHFDDAVIWAGGAILRTRSLGWNWTIVCTCAAEPTRREYFLESCNVLGAESVALGFVDHPDGGPFSRNDRDGLCAAIRAAVRSAAPAWIFTHSLSLEGEYGPHPNHTEAALAIASLVDEGDVRADQVAHFVYRRIYGVSGLPSVAGLEASHYLQLSYDELRTKAEWCARAQGTELRDPTLGGTTWLEKLAWPCPNPEAFSGRDLKLPLPFTGR